MASRSSQSARREPPPTNRRFASRPPRASLPPGQAPRRPPRASGRATAVGALFGVLLGAGGLAAFTWASGCGNESPPPGPSAEGDVDPLGNLPEPPPGPEDGDQPVVEEPDLPEKTEEPEKPWTGPWLGALAQRTPVYPTARFSKNRLGYLRRGGKAPVIDKPIVTDSCKQGFYPLVDGGYVCGKYATTKIDDPRVKLGVKAPDLEALLPYKYAYNKRHGTPLYSEVPSREDMLRYEPYLEETKKSKDEAERDSSESMEAADQPRPSTPSSDGDSGQFLRDGGLAFEGTGGAGGGAAPEIPWWQKDKKDVNVRLSDLEEADGALARRMVKGFFIAIDRTFGWNDRMWYKTTAGLVAPADRMIIPKTPELRGIEMKDFTQAGFILSAKAHKYELAGGDDRPRRAGKVARFTAIGLTGKTALRDKQRYRETVDGWWMRDRDSTWTDPGPRPSEVGDGDKWIDVNLSNKTLLAYEGSKPVYAALVAPGKRSRNKKRDHRTKTGTWRIREKHISATMDGDGVAGDLPYSIEDVPFVQYYDGSYAVHGAFWHENFGREQSHGCVNLAPFDAKHLFFWTDPPLPRGWHGVWASDKRKGTLIVVHE